MKYSKACPVKVERPAYVAWKEIELTPKEERFAESRARKQQLGLMKQCFSDAKSVAQNQGIKVHGNVLANIAVALFTKRTMHTNAFKDSLCKQKFAKKGFYSKH